MSDEQRLRDAEEEVAFWRREMTAKLDMLSRLHGTYDPDGDEAANIRANHMMPILNALRDADAKEWHTRCELCGEFLRPAERLTTMAFEEDGIGQSVHATCAHAVEGADHIFVEEDDSAEVIAKAKAIVAGPPE